jgi:hypothetical protein
MLFLVSTEKVIHTNTIGRYLQHEFDGFHGTGHIPVQAICLLFLMVRPYMWSGPSHAFSCYNQYGQMMLV